MRRVLVTGAQGFIGWHVTRQLIDQGMEVHAVGRAQADAGEKSIVHEADLTTPGVPTALVRKVKPEGLIHLAWTATPGRYLTSPDNPQWADATVELHRAFAEEGGERGVYAGTCLEYD